MQPVPRDITNKISKEEASYRPSESCMMCGHFITSGSCGVVDGSISPKAICNKYTMQEKLPEMKHAEFYQDEYKKASA
jgi:hypothetical protein